MPSRGLRPREVRPRTLGEVAAHLRCAVPDSAADVLVRGVTHDSREVRAGDLYAGLPGARVHGATFAGEVLGAGAVGMVTDAEGSVLAQAPPTRLPVLVVDRPRALLGPLSSFVYGEPTTGMSVAGVTGTNGKTTVAYLLEAILSGTGRRTGLVGTIETRVGGRRVPSVRTTPEAPDLHALFAVMREEGVDSVAMEVSSHALTMGRVDGVRFDVALFTNLSQDHLDFHGDMEDYFAAKASLFTPERCRRAVVCVDDAWGRRLAAQAGVPVTTVATMSAGSPAPEVDWLVERREVGRSGGGLLRLTHRAGQELAPPSPLPGSFNATNTALAVVTALELGVEPAAAVGALARGVTVPGRMERVQPTGTDDPLAVVDYAHTPDAVEAALAALRPDVVGPLVVVLGAGGDRDRSKRPAMGAAAARWADVVVVTDDNPRSEDAAAVRAAVLAGARREAVHSGAEVQEVGDRRAAIRWAVGRCGGPGSAVVVLGKGHETGQEVAGTVHPFDDRVELRAALEARRRAAGA